MKGAFVYKQLNQTKKVSNTLVVTFNSPENHSLFVHFHSRTTKPSVFRVSVTLKILVLTLKF